MFFQRKFKRPAKTLLELVQICGICRRGDFKRFPFPAQLAYGSFRLSFLGRARSAGHCRSLQNNVAE
jgi:hypothetical protein